MNKLRYTLLLGIFALAALGNSLDAATLTVCDQNTTTYDRVPFNGWWHDMSNTTVQMIYPSSMLTAMNGGTITSVKFYTNNGVHFSGGQYTVTMGLTDATTLSSLATISGTTATTTFVPNTNLTEIELTFNPGLIFTPGKNLIIETKLTEKGTCDPSDNHTYFVGVNQDHNCSYGNKGNTGAQKFLPKATFGYTPSTTPTISASETQLTFESEPNQAQIETVTVTGLNLTGNISATLNDANGVFSINNGANPVNLGNGGTLSITYSPTAVGTHSATVTLSSSGANPVIITLNGTCQIKTDATVCAGNGESQYLPVHGYYFDEDQHNQMLYPAAKFTNSGMNGKTINKITFYPRTSGDNTGINFYHNVNAYGEATVTIKLANVPSGTRQYDSSNPAPIEQQINFVTVVDELQMPNQAQPNLTEWVFDNLEGDFVYEGGDLLIDVTTVSGQYAYTYFIGENQGTGNYTGYRNCSTYQNKLETFLPKVRFDFEESTPITSGTVTPTEIDFSTVGVGQSVSQTVTIKNTGNQDFVPTIATNLPAGSIFTVTGSGFDIANPPTMHPNDELVLTVTFTPTESTSYNGTITVTTVDGDNNPVAVGTVTLTGAGSIIYSGEVNPNPVNFGNVQVGQSATMTVTLTNTGNQSFTPTIDASGLNGTGFSVTPTSSGAIAPNGTQNFTVTFAPTAESFDNGTFTVTIPVPNGTPIVLTVNVTGNGYEYSPSTLMSNVTDMIPVHKSDVNAYGTYMFTQDEVDDDIDMSLSYGENANGVVEVLVKNEEPVVNYTLRHKVGENGSWSNVGTTTQDSSDPKVYAYNNETFTIPSNATEMWVPMTDNRVVGSTYYYVPVTIANGIVTQGNTYGAPQVQATNVDLTPSLSIGGSKSAGRPGGHWVQTVNNTDVDYCVYTPVISISPVYPEGAVPYLVRAWLLENEDIPFFTVTRVANTNDNNTHIEGGAELTYPHPLGEMELTSEMIGGTLTIGYDWDENNAGNAGSTIQPNAFAAPSEMPQGEITIAVRVYYYKADATQSGQKALRDSSEAPEDGYGYGEGSGSDQGIPTAVSGIYADREVVDVKYVNTMGMQSDKPFEGVNIVVTRYSDGSISTTKVLK